MTATASVAQKRWTMLAVVLASGIVFLDSSVVTVALPKIGEELDSALFATLEGQQYVHNGYLLSLSALLVLAGAISDVYGRRRTLVAGLIGFGVTSLACGLAPTLDLLVLFRVLQGASGALLVPGSLSIINTTFDEDERGRAFGIWAGATAATTILGPLVGGVLVDSVSWRAAFLVNVPLVLFAIYATLRHVRETRDERASHELDWIGALAIMVAVGGLALGAIRGQQHEWRDAVAYAALAAGVVATIALVPLMRKRAHPLVPPSLFRSRNFTVANIATLLVYGALYVMFFNLSLFAQGVLGYNAAAAGIMSMPSSIPLALFSSKLGKLATKHGPRLFLAAGFAIMGAGTLWYARAPGSSDAWLFGTARGESILPPMSYVVDFLPGLVVFGIGVMMMVAPLTALVMASVPEEHSGVASALNNAISRVGPQLAGALLFIAIAATFYGALAERVPGLDTSRDDVRAAVAPLNRPKADARLELRSGRRIASAALAEPSRDASTEAFHVAMVLAAGLLFGGAVVSAVGIRNPRRRARETATGPGAAS